MINLVLLVLATWRVSNALADTGQPGALNILDKIRDLAGVKFDEYSVPYGSTPLARGVLCLWCNSVWVGLFWTAIFFLLPEPAFQFVSLPFSLSAGAILISETTRYKGDSYE